MGRQEICLALLTRLLAQLDILEKVMIFDGKWSFIMT
jgi:hypothetical protein